MARPPKVTAASMRQSQTAKTTAWNAELLRLVVGATAAALVAKLESQLQLALESPRPRTFVESAHRIENFTEARTVLGEQFGPGELFDGMKALFLTTVDAAFDKGRNFNLVFSTSADNLGVTARITWNQN